MNDRTDSALDSRERTVLQVLSILSIVIGGGSLAVFGVFLWAGSFELVSLGFSRLAILGWDAGLSLAFFVQHSGMIRRGFVRRFPLTIPAHLEGAVYSIVSGSTLLLVVGLWQSSSYEIATIVTPWRWLGRVAFGCALILFVVGTRALHGFDGFGQRPIRDRLRGRRRKAAPLTIGGPYRWVRHPLYTGVLVMIWSCPEVTADRLLFNLLWTSWIVVGTILEERDLVGDFGDEYSRYRASVPMLIPWKLRPRWPAAQDS
jgi:protein-S-isoprenylcysteine O-methyltransferase Ste14